MSSAEAIDDASSISFALDQAGEAELGEMLASYGWAAPGDLSQRGDVGIGVSECPQQRTRVGSARSAKDMAAEFTLVSSRVSECGRAIPVRRLALNVT